MSYHYYYIIAPALEMRQEPDSMSEIVSQGFFSEEVRILDESNAWVKIETTVDHYTGWAKKEGICTRQHPYFSEGSSSPSPFPFTINRLAAHLYDRQDTTHGPILTLPFESRLVPCDSRHQTSAGRWLQVILPDERTAYIQRGDIALGYQLKTKKEICRLSHAFLGLPYTWGGRSSFGYDCSGFVQMLYRQMGIFLPRDSKDQYAFDCFAARSAEEVSSGDLLFFGYGEDEIRHVGLALGKGKFIHTCASTEDKPYVRISHLDDPAWNGSGHYPYRTGRQLHFRRRASTELNLSVGFIRS